MPFAPGITEYVEPPSVETNHIYSTPVLGVGKVTFVIIAGLKPPQLDWALLIEPAFVTFPKTVTVTGVRALTQAPNVC